ncbi:MAG: hemagglutinin repeat-containing protein [Sedimenticola sp.]|nr:hemagglutinin repeat-containing protein [Sedimenticola sp.]
MITALLISPASSAWADIVADGSAPSDKRPTILRAANGTPQIDIQAPDHAGVSHNLYTRFDVDPEGVILNNTREPARTRLAGWINGNPSLAGGTARIILNEVNANDPSYLQGFVEVAGDRAQVIVANPAGITCSGCGFINAYRTTLTTGQPRFENGTLTGFQVRGGEIVVEGLGLDSRDSDYTDLIARAVKVNAGIWARRLNLVTGTNDVAVNGSLQRAYAEPGEKPEFAVDVKALGGMYAGSILLVGTEDGVGVRNAGVIGSSAGDIAITVDGKLVNRNHLESVADLKLVSAGLDNKQGLISGNAVTVDTGTAPIENGGGSLIAQDSLRIDGGDLDNRNGLVEAGLILSIDTAGYHLDNSETGESGGIVSAGTLQLNSESVDNRQGRLLSESRLEVIAGENIDNSGGRISSGQDLTVREAAHDSALTVSNTGGVLVAGGELSLVGNTLTGDGDIHSSASIKINLKRGFSNSGNIQADQLLELKTSGDLVNDGQIQAQGEVSLQATNIANLDPAVINAASTSLSATDRMENRGVVDGVDVRLVATEIDNVGTGRIYADHLMLTASRLLNRESDGASGVIAARSRLDVGVGTLVNRENALLFSAGDLVIGGGLDEDGAAIGKAGSLENLSATIEAVGQLRIAAGQVSNSNTHFSKTVKPVLVDEHHFEQKWVNGEDYYAYDYLRNVTEEVVAESAPAKLISGGDMKLEVDNLLNDKSHVLAGGTLQANLGSLENREGVLERRVTDRGTTWFSWIDYCGSMGKSKCRRESAHTAYAPADQVTSITLPMARLEQEAAIPANAVQIAPLSVSGSSAAPERVVATGGRVIHFPESPFYQVTAGAGSRHLIETDLRFTSYREWLTSDYMLGQLGLDPTNMLRRFGDGFYEQLLIQRQVTELTGKRYLAGFDDDQEQFKALMNAGVTFSRSYDLQPGIALSAEQMAHLTSDIVWLVEQELVLEDGRTERVLVPQLYAVLESGDLNGKGALLAGRNMDVEISGDLLNQGTIQAKNVLQLEADNISNTRGTISGNSVELSAKQDIDNKAGLFQSDQNLVLRAERDISVRTATHEEAEQVGVSQFQRRDLDGAGTLRVVDSGGRLLAEAGRDIHLKTARIVNRGESGLTGLVAGNNISLDTTTTRRRDAVVWDSRSYRTETRSEEVGTQIGSAGDLALLAGSDIDIHAAGINSDGTLVVGAGRDLTVGAGVEEQGISRRQFIAKSGLFASKQTIDEHRSTTSHVVGSTLSADRVDLQAGHNLSVTGSQVVSTENVTLQAENNIDIQSEKQTTSSYSHHSEKKSGLMTSGGLGITLGKREMSNKLDHLSSTAVESTIGSVKGDVVIESGSDYTQRGSNLLAPEGSISVAAKSIEVIEAQNRMTVRSESRFKQSGLTISISNPVIDSVQTVQQMYEAAKQVDDPRMQALAAATAALSANNAYEQVKAGQGSKIGGKEGQIKTGETNQDGTPETRDATVIDKMGGLTFNISLGSSKSESSSHIDRTIAVGSTIQVGRDISLIATNEEMEGEILVRGSQISAARDISLYSGKNIDLIAAESGMIQRDLNKSSSGSFGVRIGMGPGSTGISVTASAARSDGAIDNTELTHIKTRVNAGSTATLRSGNNTTLKGAVVSGDSVAASVGGDLLIESVQDSANYQAREKSSSAGLSIPVVGAGSLNASLSKARLTATGDYASVTEPSGIRAGGGGFDIEVDGNTGLKGGIIASSDKAIVGDQNRLTTETLAIEDLSNRSTASAEASGKSLSTDMLTQGKYGIAKGVIANTALNGERAGASSGWTRAAIGEGTVVITDEQKQKKLTGRTTEETIALLNRDTDNSYRAAEKQDADGMRRQVETEQKIKQAVFAEAVKFSDEAYRTMFLRDHPFYEILRDESGQPLVDSNTGKLKLRLLSEEEKRNLRPGSDGKIHIAANGIFNDEEAAAKYALQHSSESGPLYLVHFPEANRVVSELMIAGYQRFLESDLLGLTNSTAQVKNTMEQYGQSGLHMDGHSRGAMTIGNAMESLENTPDSKGSLSHATVNFFGPAYNAVQADILLSGLQDRSGMPEEMQAEMVLKYQNHVADPVGRFVGNNPPTGGTVPQDSSVLTEMFRAVIGEPDTSHNLYYVDATNFKPELKSPERQKIIDDYWSGSTPILTPAR